MGDDVHVPLKIDDKGAVTHVGRFFWEFHLVVYEDGVEHPRPVFAVGLPSGELANEFVRRVQAAADIFMKEIEATEGGTTEIIRFPEKTK